MEPLSIGLLIVAALGTAESVHQGNVASQEADRQADTAAAAAESKRVAGVRKSAREARIAQARALQKAELGGTAGSSGVAGQISDITSQTAGFIAQTNEAAFQQQSQINSQQVAKQAQVKGANAGAVAGLAGSIFAASYSPGGATPDKGGKVPTYNAANTGYMDTNVTTFNAPNNL